MERDKSSMTALVSAFSRAYHAKNSKVKVFNDSVAEKLLTTEEYQEIANNMVQGIKYFDPNFTGNDEEALEFIVNHYLAPSPVGRAAFTENKLEKAILEGASQYCIFAAGFDSFAYRQPDYAKKLQIFEIDHPMTSQNKQQRVSTFLKAPIENLHYIQADFTEANWQKALIECKAYDMKSISFCSLLGIIYYLEKVDFEKMLRNVSQLVAEGSRLVFDYPARLKNSEGEEKSKLEKMANQANESMLAKYTKDEMEALLLKYGFEVKEHLEPNEITEQFFVNYNQSNPRCPMKAKEKVNYCEAVLRNKI